MRKSAVKKDKIEAGVETLQTLMKQVMIERLQEWAMSWQWPDRVV